jgi:ankyrin repeat protein
MDVNMTGGVCGNALQAAATEGHENIVQLLLRNVADINLAGGPFSSALEAALGRGHSKVVEILLSYYGANQIGPFGTTTRQVAEGTEDRTSDSVVLNDREVDQDGLDSM